MQITDGEIQVSSYAKGFKEQKQKIQTFPPILPPNKLFIRKAMGPPTLQKKKKKKI